MMNTLELFGPDHRLKVFRKVTRFWNAGGCTYDEYAFNVITLLVGADLSEVTACLGDLPSEQRNRLVMFAEAYFRDNDFTPYPGLFMVDTNNPEEVVRKGQEMRPKFRQLMEYLKMADERSQMA
ncbi:MAG: hypothetical protein EA424_10265 [Planctomycetaceae bacterium]|nr:MAG: hypothetical protein EA424_10265 [Planctomycetaceae bacterium]